jgi:sugar O-acyltransferase (sialic acid O-acetyltransferase NeuD family)
MSEALFVFGASGHCKVVIDTLRRAGGEVVLLVDDDVRRTGDAILGHVVAGSRDALVLARESAGQGIVAIGRNEARLAVAAWLRDSGFGFGVVVDPSAVVSAFATIGGGTLVVAHAVVNADARVGQHVIVNTAATVDHDCVVGDGVHLAPGVHLCGDVRVGRGTFIGAGTVVVPGVRIGIGAVIGAGSTVLANVPDCARVAGSPCRPLGSAP